MERSCNLCANEVTVTRFGGGGILKGLSDLE
jgi:hypothetical protein